MKKIIILYICIFVFSSSVYAQKLVLRFNTDEFAPFHYSIEGKASGPVVDIINYACEKLNIDCVYEVLPWRRALKEIKDGDADGLFVVAKNKSREALLYISLPIITTEYGFFVLKSNNAVFKNLDDIQGYNVGVYGPSNTNRALVEISNKLETENKKPLNIRVLHDDLLIFKQLNSQNRGLQAVYSNKDVGLNFMRKLNLKNIKYMGKNKELDYYIGFSKKTVSKDLVVKFNKVLRNMHQNNELKKILDQYFLERAHLNKF